jgi:hypothetical protein
VLAKSVMGTCQKYGISRGQTEHHAIIRLVNALRWIAAVCFSSVLALAACSGKAGGGGDDKPDASNPGNDDGGTPPPPDASGPDTDGDGIPDAVELEDGTDPNDPDSDDDGLNDGRENEYGSDPNDADSDDDGLTDGEEDQIGTNPNDEGCENQDAEASRGKLPADIIIAFDNSTSMNEEAAAVEDNLNTDLAVVLAEDGIDYRIIALADFPPTNAENGIDPTDPNMCIGPPLATNQCASLPAGQTKSINNDRFIQYDQPIGSDDALRTLITEFDATGGGDIAPAQYPNGWGVHLRDNAKRIFIIITDDEASGDNVSENFQREFANKLKARFPADPTLPDCSDDAQSCPNTFIMHSILGMIGKPDGTAWLPEEPVQTQRCTPGSQDEGQFYQQLSKDTGGLRFPLCNVNDTNPNNDNFDEIFNAIADNVVNEVNLPCTFTPGENQADLNFDGTKLIYRPAGTGPLEAFDEVTPDTCGDSSGAFYKIETPGELPVFELCPATCDRVSADPTGKINLIIDCTIQIG